MSGGLHVHVGGGVERRTAQHQEQAAIREAIESGTAATVVPGRAVLLTVVALPAASVDVHEDAPNYGRPKTVCEWKKKASERKRAKAMREWQRGAHLPGAVEAVQTVEDESLGRRHKNKNSPLSLVSAAPWAPRHRPSFG